MIFHNFYLVSSEIFIVSEQKVRLAFRFLSSVCQGPKIECRTLFVYSRSGETCVLMCGCSKNERFCSSCCGKMLSKMKIQSAFLAWKKRKKRQAMRAAKINRLIYCSSHLCCFSCCFNDVFQCQTAMNEKLDEWQWKKPKKVGK